MHEKQNEEHGIITFMHRWLVVTEEDTLPAVEKYIVNVTHATAVTYTAEASKQVCRFSQSFD